MFVSVCTADSTEGQVEFDQYIHKLGPMSPTQSKRELYRSIQKGGNIPQHGLQQPAASDRKGVCSYLWSDVIMELCVSVYVSDTFQSSPKWRIVCGCETLLSQSLLILFMQIAVITDEFPTTCDTTRQVWCWLRCSICCRCKTAATTNDNIQISSLL